MTATPPVVEAADPAVRTTVFVLGSTVVLELARPAWADRVRRLLDPFVVGATPGRDATVLAVLDDAGAAVLRRDGAVLVRGSWPAVEARLLAELNAIAVAGFEGFAVHAGVVARGDRVVCFPGESGLGKSTMTAACLQAGFAYVSDEALCLDRASRGVVPYPRPLALSSVSCALLGLPATTRDHGDTHDDTHDDEARWESHLVAADLGARAVALTDRPHLTDVVELQRGATEVHLEPLHRARAVPALLAMSFNHFKEPGSSVELVGAIAREVRVWRLHHDDPVEAAALLRRELG